LSAKKKESNRKPGVNLILRKPIGASKSFSFTKVIVGASGERKQKKHDCEALKSINNGYKKGIILHNDALDLLENVRPDPGHAPRVFLFATH
jgi:hypothetical protein